MSLPKTFPVIMVAALLMAIPQPASAQRKRTVSELERVARVLTPAPELLRVRQIPWEADFVEAFRTAKATNRPVFIWAYGGRGTKRFEPNPLEGC